ncbi:hypothetical protein [Mammaliicoccus sciuri]|uniref:hypothetical protein n=1 Tax=Mammaliicoccus sciuri TaxID=1296 RepID=UPI00211EDA51|nr:hypothetical protein [Mammaliicoccus sciuri]
MTSAGIFGYAKYKEMELKQENLQTQLDDKNDASANNKNSSNNQEQVNTDETQTQEINSTEENAIRILESLIKSIYVDPDGSDKALAAEMQDFYNKMQESQ